MDLIGIAKLLARGVGQFYAAVDVLAWIDLEGLEFHYDVERIDSSYIVSEVGADTERHLDSALKVLLDGQSAVKVKSIAEHD